MVVIVEDQNLLEKIVKYLKNLIYLKINVQFRNICL